MVIANRNILALGKNENVPSFKTLLMEMTNLLHLERVEHSNLQPFIKRGSLLYYTCRDCNPWVFGYVSLILHTKYMYFTLSINYKALYYFWADFTLIYFSLLSLFLIFKFMFCRLIFILFVLFCFPLRKELGISFTF